MKRPHFMNLRGPTSYPRDHRDESATLQPQSERHENDGCDDLINENHIPATAGLLPPAAERFVELNQALIFVVSRLREGEFSLK